MIEIDIILGNRCAWREEMICTSGAQMLIVAKSGLTHRTIVLWIMAWSTDCLLQLERVVNS